MNFPTLSLLSQTNSRKRKMTESTPESPKTPVPSATERMKAVLAAGKTLLMDELALFKPWFFAHVLGGTEPSFCAYEYQCTHDSAMFRSMGAAEFVNEYGFCVNFGPTPNSIVVSMNQVRAEPIKSERGRAFHTRATELAAEVFANAEVQAIKLVARVHEALNKPPTRSDGQVEVVVYAVEGIHARSIESTIERLLIQGYLSMFMRGCFTVWDANFPLAMRTAVSAMVKEFNDPPVLKEPVAALLAIRAPTENLEETKLHVRAFKGAVEDFCKTEAAGKEDTFVVPCTFAEQHFACSMARAYLATVYLTCVEYIATPGAEHPGSMRIKNLNETFQLFGDEMAFIYFKGVQSRQGAVLQANVERVLAHLAKNMPAIIESSKVYKIAMEKDMNFSSNVHVGVQSRMRELGYHCSRWDAKTAEVMLHPSIKIDEITLKSLLD